MDISPLQSRIQTENLPFEKLASNPNISQSDKVKEACRQFEAVLTRQILQEARKTVISSSGESNSSINGIYDDMINNQMAESMTRSGGFGLAKSLQAQLVHQSLKTEVGAPAHGQAAAHPGAMARSASLKNQQNPLPSTSKWRTQPTN